MFCEIYDSYTHSLFVLTYCQLLTIVFVLQQSFLQLKILMMMLLTFLYHNWDAPFYYKSLITFLLIGMVFVIISGMFYGRIYLTWMILLLKLCLRSEFRFKLMYVCLIESIRSILLYLHVFNLLLLLSMQEISSITATNRTDML